MGSSQSLPQGLPQGPCAPIHSIHPEKYTLETLLLVSHSHPDEFSPEELQSLQQKLDGTYVNPRYILSAEDLRRNLIIAFCSGLYVWLQAPTHEKAFEISYLRYTNVLEAEHTTEAAFESCITSDFRRARKIIAFSLLELLEVVEKAFKTGVMPITWQSAPRVPNLYGKNAMKMVKFFEALRYDGSVSNDEAFLLRAISRLLEIYRAPAEWYLESHMRKLEQNIYTSYRDSAFKMYDTTSLKLYRCFHLVDSYDLQKRMEGMDATSDCLQLANLATKFLLHGKLFLEARHWLSDKVSSGLSPEELSELADFPDLQSESGDSDQGNQSHSSTISLRETESQSPAEISGEDPSTDDESADVSDNTKTPLLETESLSPRDNLEEDPSSDDESVKLSDGSRVHFEEDQPICDEYSEAFRGAENLEKDLPTDDEDAEAWESISSQEEDLPTDDENADDGWGADANPFVLPCWGSGLETKFTCFSCCGQSIPSLKDLLLHHEEYHEPQTPQSPRNGSFAQQEF